MFARRGLADYGSKHRRRSGGKVHRILFASLILGVSGLGFAGCSSESPDTSAGALGPAEYCVTVSPAWDADAIPNYDDEMSGAERATAVSDFKAAIDALPQGVELGALNQQQSDLLVRALPFYLALYENPELSGASPAQVAEAAGMSLSDFEAMNTGENTAIATAGRESLVAFCQ